MNFRAEAKTETSIVLSWSPPRQEIIVKYELLYKEGDHSKEVSPECSRIGAEELPGPAAERGEQGGVSGQASPLLPVVWVYFSLPASPTPRC